MSQNIVIGEVWEIPKLPRRYFRHCSSQVKVVIAQYSASAEECETVACFLIFQEIRLEPKNVQ